MASEEARSNKRRKGECTTFFCLPSDIIERIFLKLPISTLVSCAGVCKQWRSFIQDPQFVTSHLQHAPRYALLFFPQESVSRQLYPSDAILIDEVGSRSTSAVPVIGPDDFLFGSCNGLLGLYTKRSTTIKIANFATGECLHLEKPVKNLRGDHFSLYNFGFHPVTKQYKITHFLCDRIHTGRPHYNDRASVIQVYTLGDEKWKDIPTPEPLSLKCVTDSGVVNVDGTLYWLIEDMIASWQHVVMSFDLSEESFARIRLPEVILDPAHGESRQYWIGEIDGKICIATAQTIPYVPILLARKFQIWTLDNKREHKWSQKYNIKYPSGFILGPNCVHGDKIIMQHRDGNLRFCQLLGDPGKIVDLLDFRPRKHNVQYHNCVKSLVRLDVFKKAGIVHMPKQRKGWELKKWQPWEHEISKVEALWCHAHQAEHAETALAQSMHTALNSRLTETISDDVTRQQIGMQINQIFPAFPPQQARPLRRLNCVEQKRDNKKLFIRFEKVVHALTATAQVFASVSDMIRSATQDQKETPISEAGIASENHSDDIET